MRTRRSIAINNSLVHGICNYSCRLCSVNKPVYKGPREFQRFDVTSVLIRRILEASSRGIRIAYVTNSGDGEPTLHPEFLQRMNMFGEMIREWPDGIAPPPEVSVVTNGSRLNLKHVRDALISNPLTLIVSLPTVEEKPYGRIMMDDPAVGEELLSTVRSNISTMMRLHSEGDLSRLYFHVSPPETELIRSGFERTIGWLTSTAKKSGLNSVELVLFPAVSNRAGRVRSSVVRIDTYRDLFRLYNNSVCNGVRISMKLVIKRFFGSIWDLIDLLKCFRFPCLWNANFFITPDGSSICCNDQAAVHSQGSILDKDLSQLMEVKEKLSPRSICYACNQAPWRLRGSPAAIIFALSTRIRMRLSRSSIVDTGIAIKPEKKSPAGYINSSEPSLPLSEEEFKELYRLVYRRYLKNGYQSPDSSEMRLTLHNLLLYSYPIMIRDKGRVAGTITVVRENSLGLPMQSYFEDKLREKKKRGGLLCELSALAFHDQFKLRESREMLLSLFRYAFILSRDILGCTDFCMMTNPKHSIFYRKVFHFSVIGETRECDSVNGAPAVPMYLDLESSEEKLKESNPELYDYFSITGRENTRQEIVEQLGTHAQLYSAGFIGDLLQCGNKYLSTLSNSEWSLLQEHYPGLERKGE